MNTATRHAGPVRDCISMDFSDDGFFKHSLFSAELFLEGMRKKGVHDG
jgi:hypothetical protein